MTDADRAFNPFDADQVQHAWPLLAELRKRSAVASIEGGMHYVTRHAECRAVLRDVASFSNASGFKQPGVEVPLEDRVLGELDPPLHTSVRRVMVTALTPRVVHAAEPFIRETSDALLAGLPVPGRADLVPSFTAPLPTRVTAHLLGFPPADADRLAGWAKELMESGFPATNRSERGEGFERAFPEFAGYIDEQIEDRARAAASSGDDGDSDVLTRLLALDVGDGSRLTRRQVRALTRNLITGGFTTTSQLIGNLLDALLRHAELERALRDSPGALGTAIEESLRLSPPVLFVPRGCMQDVDVAETTVHAGERVIAGTASANRDDRVFDDPDTFRIDRENPEQHLTFGYGPHVCPGAALARIEARIAITAFLDRFPSGTVRLEPGYEFVNVPTFFECGPRELPVELGPASG
ncbi:MAG TPA: cytochrome P450 [Acidimicrobiia bacterium]